MNLELEGKVALVTGAGRYMGRAMALELANEGVKLVVNDLMPDRAETVAKEIQDRGGQAIAAPADITDYAQVERIAKAADDEFGGVDILVNNAGIPAPADEKDTTDARAVLFADTDPATWSRWVDLNYYGTLNCTRVVTPGMRDREFGRIICIMSDAGRTGEPRRAVYSGAKAAMAGFLKSVAKEMGRYRVTANCVSLGAVIHKEWAEQWGEEGKERVAKIMRLYPAARGLDRLGLPEDAAYLVTCLASPRASWITGQVISVSGGFTMI
jgi:NAD(P)-dependent dehydrogenase (short-subunit alcohol dehydrogenase family)